ncbi:MAG TPA: CheR family methyltransferase [Candidatus Wunengus sp. YC63]|uniref:CheR family methyltransferase n=1 Tax=unclassified Candidatus Wunengus TaxID=3367695 RepID=UPI0040280B26
MKSNDDGLRLLLSKIYEERGFDFRQYNTNMLERRLARRLSTTGAKTYQEYARVLDVDSSEYEKLFDGLTINVSHFFRDPLVFELLYKVVLPEMIAYKAQHGDTYIRTWSAGCAQGEEPYSVAILLTELLGEQLNDYHVTIYATDIDRNALDKAKIGEYQESGVLEVKKGFLDKYFSHNRSYKIKESIKELVDFSFHDLASEKFIAPPRSVFANFDLILCRNVLIYFTRELQRKVLSNLEAALNKGGYLVLGETETLPMNMQKDFICKDGMCKIYQKL